MPIGHNEQVTPVVRIGSDTGDSSPSHVPMLESPLSSPAVTMVNPTPSPAVKSELSNRISRQEAGLSEIPFLQSNHIPLEHSILELLRDADSYGDDDYQAGIVKDDGAIILSGKYKGSITGDIKIGTSIDDVAQRLGESSFTDGDVHYYKTELFYLGISGKYTVEEAIIAKTPHTSFSPDILEQIRHALNDNTNNSLSSQLENHPELNMFFDYQGHIHGGGWYAKSDSGIEVSDFHDYNFVNVTNDFPGEIFKNKDDHEKFKIKYEDIDSIGKDLSGKLLGYRQVNERFAREGKLSPSGRLNSIYEWIYSMRQYFIIRTTDGSLPDYQLPGMVEDYAWLTDNNILYIDIYEQKPMLLSVQENNPTTTNLLEVLGLSNDDSRYSLVEVKEGRIKLKQETGIGKESSMMIVKYMEDQDKKVKLEIVE